MRAVHAEYAGTDLPRDGLPEIALFGRSNAGKSTLINMIAGTRGLAHVGKTPGKTRYRYFFRLDRRMYLVDLPGYGYSEASIRERGTWERLIRDYVSGRAALVAGVLVVDARRCDTPLDRELATWWSQERREMFVVATKADKLNQSDAAKLGRDLRDVYGAPADRVFVVSPQAHRTVDRLRHMLFEFAKQPRVLA
ncbi:MAG: ribosome biogenesis GTP-binding protein YsxC [Acidobacteria bacterium]|nr:ribosome biogenesis GTP-binding protein YsxC [Acidobacteriota bacterium]